MRSRFHACTDLLNQARMPHLWSAARAKDMTGLISGFRFIPGFLDSQSQTALLRALEAVLAAAPLYVPRMPKSGRPLSVRMSNCGSLGWVSDKGGYRYQSAHPET